MSFHDLFFNSRLGYLLQVIPWMLLATGVFWLLRGQWLKRRRLSRGGLLHEMGLLVFTCYLSGLLALVCTPANFWSRLWYFLFYGRAGDEGDPLFSGSFNLVPTLLRYLTGEYTGGSWILFMYVGNTLLFLPFGLLLPAVCNVGLNKTLGLALILSLGMELFQPVVGRSFDTDDLITNLLGALLGYLLFCICKSVFQKRR